MRKDVGGKRLLLVRVMPSVAVIEGLCELLFGLCVLLVEKVEHAEVVAEGNLEWDSATIDRLWRRAPHPMRSRVVF